MESSRKKQAILMVVNICAFMAIMYFGYRKFIARPATLLTKAPSDAINVLHFNDGYDVRKTPAFVTRYFERKEAGTLSLFSGDIVSPSLISNYMKGNQFVKFLTQIDVQLAVPGNHEYDFGEEHFESFVAKMKVVWLVANMKVKDDPTKILSNLKEYEIKEVNGQKVGIFGLVDTNWQKSSKLDLAKFDYEPFDDAAKRVSKLLKDQGCSLIFVVSHMANASDMKVLSDENSVDVVFGGHDHVYFIRRINNKLLLKSGSDFDYFSQVKMFFSKESDKSYCNKSCLDFNYLLDEEKNDDMAFFSFSLPRKDKFLHVAIEKVKIEDKDIRNEESLRYIRENIDPMIRDFLLPMVRVDTKMDTRETIIGNKEIEVGNLFSDIARAYYGTDLAMVNAGMFKSEKLFHRNIFFRKIDLMKVFPYKRDVFITLQLTGKEIIEAIEDTLSQYPKLFAKFLSISGLEYKFDPRKEEGKRLMIESITLSGIPIDQEKTYSVATPTGLQHEKFGIPNLREKTGTNPVEDQLAPVDLFEKFSKLTNEIANVNEYAVFKKQFPGFKFDRMALVKPADEEKGVARLGPINEAKTDDETELKALSKDALKRLRMYSLTDEIVNVDDRNVFVISPVVDKRMEVNNIVVVL